MDAMTAPRPPGKSANRGRAVARLREAAAGRRQSEAHRKWVRAATRC